MNVNDPGTVGVPEISPVAPVSARPAGGLPATTANEYGPALPLAVTVEEYAAATVPFATVAGATRTVPQTRMEYARSPMQPFEAVARTVKV